MGVVSFWLDAATMLRSMHAPAFASFDDFFLYYLRQHSHPLNRILHACGTAAGLLILLAMIAFGRLWLALLWIPVSYGLAWLGHFFIERNMPATFSHPWWAFICDFRMLGLMLTGRLQPWLERAARLS